MVRSDYGPHSEAGIRSIRARRLTIKRLRRASLWVGAALLFTSLMSSPASAAPGDLDATFSEDGWVLSDFGGFDWGEDVAIQSDGKIVVVGRTSAGGNEDFAVARYETNGTLDATFADSGQLTMDLSGRRDMASSVALQDNGSIVVAGSAWAGPDARRAFALVRLTATGELDATFGPGGVVTTNFTPRADWAAAVAIRGDGSIVAAGGIDVPGDFAVAMYTSDGTLDSSFSGDGRRRVGFSARREMAEDLAIQSNGKIVVSGFSQDRLAIARLFADGRLDSSFSADGKTVLDGLSEWSSGLALQPDGKIVASGGTPSQHGTVFLLVRYKRDGYRDRTFSKDGIRKIDIRGPYAENPPELDIGTDVAVQADGKLIEVGVTGDAASGNQWFGLARIRPGGRTDPSFGGDGQVVTRFEGLDWAKAMALQDDGSIVVAGTAIDLSSFSADFLVARYLA
jgi:uncharacterized delta-60 repeat protein